MKDLKKKQKKLKKIFLAFQQDVKMDLEERKAIPYQVAKDFAKSLGMCYFETSAKMSINCFEAADYLAKLCFEQILNKNAKENFKLQHDLKKSGCY